jgi:enamine deaminase RidA (YjgF/YER057c/UK114 family)
MSEVLQPPGWKRPRGYSNGIATSSGRQVFIAGQIGWTAEETFEAQDFAGQMRQALANVVTILAEAGGKPEDVAQLTCFLTDKKRFFAEGKACGEAHRAIFGKHYPATTIVEVTALMHDQALIEIAAIAVIPER